MAWIRWRTEARRVTRNPGYGKRGVALPLPLSWFWRWDFEALKLWNKSKSFRWRGSLFFACAKKRSSAAAG
jgi:hypothetical protein